MKTVRILKQLQSPTKITILCWLLENKEGLTVGELHKKMENVATRVNISKQLSDLRKEKVISKTIQGRYHTYRFNFDNISPEIKNIIISTVNSYHLIDEGKDHIPYKHHDYKKSYRK